MTRQDGLRERKKRQTRAALSWAAVRLTVDRGWDEVTVADIAAAADVSERTFRNYFSGKADAIAFRHLDRMLSAAEALRTRPAGEPLWDAVLAAMRERFARDAESAREPRRDDAAMREWRRGVRLMTTHPELSGEMVRVGAEAQDALAAAVAERTGTDAERDVYPKLVAAAIGAAVSVALRHSMLSDPPEPMETVLPDVLRRLPEGLPAP